MNNTFVIDDGLRDYVFKNKKGEVFAEFSFNPADTGLLERYHKVVDFLNNYNVQEGKDNLEALIIQLNKDLREQIDFLFGRSVSDDIFANRQPCDIIGTGDFYYEAALETITKIIEGETGERVQKKLKKISKYTKQYHK